MDKASLAQQDQSGTQPYNDPSQGEPQIAQSHQSAPPAYEENPQQYPQQLQPPHQPQQQQPPPGYQQPYQQRYAEQKYPATNVAPVLPPLIVQPVEDVNDNMVLSIVSLFFCCILGIFAIMKSQDARHHKLSGNYDMARMAARTAKNLAIIGIVLGCLGTGIGIVLGTVLPLIHFWNLDYDVYGEN